MMTASRNLGKNLKRNSEVIEKGTLYKRMFFLLVLTFIVSSIWAGPIDENAARSVANKVLQSSQTKQNASSTQQKAASTSNLQLLYVSSSNSESANGTMLKSTSSKTVYFYVFGTENNDCFVIVAADDRVTPILGYSDENGFSADNMPPNLKWWLGEYAKQIQFAIENDIEPTAEVKKLWAQYLGINNNGKEE